jgi:glyoxylase-like metal-dependent hydrolase (beta-lactamase superfamily II)
MIRKEKIRMNKIVMLDINFEYKNDMRTINPVLLIGNNEVVLVDCGYPNFLTLLETEMKSKGIDPNSLTKVLITHHDDDHMGALSEIKEKYPNIKVVASEIESEYISGRKKSLRLMQAEEILKDLSEDQKQFGIEFCESLRKVKPVNVDITVKDGDCFNWAGGCRVISTPGHMPGHISLYVRETNSIVTGDAAVIENGKLVIANPQFTLDFDMAEDSLEKIISMNADNYYCYHGGKFISTTGGLIMKNEKSELSPKQREELLSALRARFEKNMNRHKGLEWAKVEAKLEANTEKLWSLNEMEITGGEPDVVGYDNKTDEYIFYDCSSESPKGRRGVCFDREALESRKEHRPENNAIDMAATMGIELLTEEQYRELQKLGNFDTKTSSWVKTPANIRTLGGAIFCDRRYDTVFVYHNGAESYYAARGFRGSLRI